MEETIEELQARIAAVQGKIDVHKQQHVPPPTQYHRPYHPYPTAYRGAPRWAPYGRGRGNGRGRYAPPVKNRTLVLNGAKPPTNELALPTPVKKEAPQHDNFVATHTHQLVNKDAYDRHQHRKEQLRATRRQQINQTERTALIQHTASQGGRKLLIEGIRFRLRDDGSKLVRISGATLQPLHKSNELNTTDTTTTNKVTPKMVKVADVAFFRTKNGNLVRASAVKNLTRNTNRATKRQCEHFTKHGKCPFGRSCRFAHDPDKVAICPAFLKSNCTAGEYCDLSHVMSINRVPACIHFLRGNCTNDACRYPHVNVSPSAPVCAPFARLGYCANNDCDKRHVFECPDYANKGKCADTKCALPHPVRAHVLRKAAAKQAKVGSEDESDISSDEEDQTDTGFEDIDSDEAEDVIMGENHDYGHELTQQQDFVSFS